MRAQGAAPGELDGELRGGEINGKRRDSNTDYAARAREFAPVTLEELRAAARQMARDGLGEHSIAAALQVDVNAVRRLIGTCSGCDQ